MLEPNDNVETYLQWADRMAAFYESHDELGVSTVDCWEPAKTDAPEDDIDLPDYI